MRLRFERRAVPGQATRRVAVRRTKRQEFDHATLAVMAQGPRRPCPTAAAVTAVVVTAVAVTAVAVTAVAVTAVAAVAVTAVAVAARWGGRKAHGDGGDSGGGGGGGRV